MKRDTLERLRDSQQKKVPVALATDLASGDETLIFHDQSVGSLGENSDFLDQARRSLQDDKSGIINFEGRDIFIHVFNPPLRMAIVGAVHIAQPLSRMATVAGYDVIVIDPRQSFATAERFPGVQIIDEWPDEGMKKIDPDRRTAVVTLTHDPKLDDPGLTVALNSPAFYIGSLGSRKTHASRVDRLKEAGFSEDDINRIHGPVGLNLRAVSPAEIAVSILAEITATLHAREETTAA
ncbi:MAG: XdhC family protein [Rhodospirillaceae bacterium]